VLKPSFLPEEEHAAAHAHAGRPRGAGHGRDRSPVQPRPPPRRRAQGDRLGEAIQLVYTEESGFRTGAKGSVSRPPAVEERDASLL
jgi:hypothetical protein